MFPQHLPGISHRKYEEAWEEGTRWQRKTRTIATRRRVPLATIPGGHIEPGGDEQEGFGTGRFEDGGLIDQVDNRIVDHSDP